MTTIQSGRISGFSRLGAQWAPAVEDLVPSKRRSWQKRLPAIPADRSVRVHVRTNASFVAVARSIMINLYRQRWTL